MRTKFIAAIAFLALAFTGCKNDKTDSKEAAEEAAEEKLDETFKVSVNVLVKKNDDFQLYYRESPSDSFSEEKSLWVSVKGSETAQTVNFELPEGVLPTFVRLDFGVNKQQEDIVLNEIDFEYIGKKFAAKGVAIGNYFTPIKPTTFDLQTGVLKAVDDSGARVEPMLQPNEVLGDELRKLIQ